jgi:predicted DNA-binding transcriptional regulator YafY
MMYRLEHVYKLHQLLQGRRSGLSRAALEEALEIPRSTLTRLLRICQDRLHMPVVYDRARGGYCYDLQPGVLKPWIDPLQQRISDLLEHRHAGSKEVWRRIKILPMANREARLEDFQRCADALVTRRRLRMLYRSRSNSDGNDFERQVSPQRLIYYRDNWYLDAWCHQRRALRTFALDRMQVLGIGKPAIDIDDSKLQQHLESARRPPAFKSRLVHRKRCVFPTHVGLDQHSIAWAAAALPAHMGCDVVLAPRTGIVFPAHAVICREKREVSNEQTQVSFGLSHGRPSIRQWL